MRKWITCFFTVCLLAVALSVTAFAAGTVGSVSSTDSSGVTLEKNGEEKVNVTYASAETGKEYLVLATKKAVTPTSLKADDIVYINQETATGSGVTFTVYPSELKTQTYYVYMSSNASSGITALTQVGTYVAEGPAVLKGDTNKDTKLTSWDASVILRHLARIETITDSDVLQAADTNEDGKITSWDASVILRHLAKIELMPEWTTT